MGAWARQMMVLFISDMLMLPLIIFYFDVFPSLQELSLERKMSIKNSLTLNKLESTFEYDVESFTCIKVDEANSISFLD